MDNTGNSLFSDPVGLSGRQEQLLAAPRRHLDARRRRHGGRSRRLGPLLPEDAVLELHADRVGRRVRLVRASFTASIFPTNNVDPGPSAGRLPTDPFLVNGPVVNRALLNPMYPAGHDDEEHRHRAASTIPIGICRTRTRRASASRSSWPASMAVSADYIHAEPSRSLHAAGPEPRHPRHHGPHGRGRAHAADSRVHRRRARARQRRLRPTTTRLQASIQKRFSNGYQFRVSYTLFARRTARRGARRHRHDHDLHDRSGHEGDDLQPGRSRRAGRSGSSAHPVAERRGRSAAHQGPERQRRLAVQQRHAVHAHRQQHRSEPQRQLRGAAAGRHLQRRGVATRTRSRSRTRAASTARAARTSRSSSMRAGYRFKLPRQPHAQAHVDVFNVTNRANFNNPTGRLVRDAATFLILRSIRNGGPTRTAQFNVRYSF